MNKLRLIAALTVVCSSGLLAGCDPIETSTFDAAVQMGPSDDLRFAICEPGVTRKVQLVYAAKGDPDGVVWFRGEGDFPSPVVELADEVDGVRVTAWAPQTISRGSDLEFVTETDAGVATTIVFSAVDRIPSGHWLRADGSQSDDACEDS